MTAVCLVRPPAVETLRFATTTITPPLGLAYIAAALEEAGHAVSVIDAVAESPGTRTRYLWGYLVGLRFDAIAARVPSAARVVGITVTFTHEWPLVVRLVEILRAARPDVTIILGGEHVTAMPELSLATSMADAVVLGEGEETILDLLDALARGRDLGGVAGIAYRAGDAVCVTARRPRRRDIDAIAWPAWHHFDLATYNRHGYVDGMQTGGFGVPLLATRGCPYQCTFCSSPGMWTPRWIPRDPARVADEMAHWRRTVGATSFPLQDLTAITKKSWIVAFCRELVRRRLDVTWQLPSGTRSEAIDAEVAALLARTGMVSMAYAAESGSEETRRLIKKKVQRDRLLESVRAAVGAGLNVTVFVVIGFPHDTPDQLAQTLPFLDEVAGLGVRDLQVNFFMAHPGSELFHFLADSGQLRLDRAYFRQILHGSAFFPAVAYGDAPPRGAQAAWKARYFARFYAGEAGGGLLRQLGRGLGGLQGKEPHGSRLPSAFRHAARAAVDSVAARVGPAWASPATEAKMFDGWDALYRRIRAQQLAAGVPGSPANAAELHRHNVTGRLPHGRRRVQVGPRPAPS